MESREFSLDHPCGVRICRILREAEVADLDGTNKQDMGTLYVWYSLPVAAIDEQRLAVSLCFHNGVLDSLRIAMVHPDLYGSGWDDWSEEKERLCAEHTEDWLREAGYPTGTYPWGEVWAGYDSKGGSGGGCIRYKT